MATIDPTSSQRTIRPAATPTIAAASFVAKYDSPEATAKVIVEAVRTSNVPLMLTCMTDASVKSLRESLRGYLNELGEGAFEGLLRESFLPAFNGFQLGKLVAESADARQYNYSTEHGAGAQPQTFVKVGGKWLLAD